MRILLIILAFTAALALRAMAQPLPDLGDGARGVLPPLVERKIGEAIVREIRQRDPTYLDDPEVADYLNELGARLSAAIPGGRQDFEFLVIRDHSINAFALPGGFIGVHTGLLLASESESEVASVLAHEMAHVTQRHIARMLGTQQQIQLPAMIAVAAALLLGGSRPDLAQAAAMAAQGVAVQAQLGYSRDYEREADRIGFQTLANAGFDTHAMSGFFEKMQRQSRALDDGSVPGYLRTHPVTTERIADVQARAESQPYRQHLDSPEYHLVRAKLRAEAGEPRDAVTHFRSALRDRRFASEEATRYGLALALLRAQQPREAAAELQRLAAAGKASSMLVLLEARVRQALGDAPGGLKALREGAARWPHRRSLAYAYGQALNQAGRHDDALAHAGEQLRRYPRDPQLHELRARTFAAQGKRLQQHQAQAEVYVLRGSLPAAIEQLQLAQAAGDGNFYELSAVDARLKELRAEHARDLQESRKR
jgi:beta-barrel assembly-enhancing protease